METDLPVALVTGGASGIGKQITRDLLQADFRVVFTDMANEKALKFLEELKAFREKVSFYFHDLAKVETTRGLLRRILSQVGCPDCLVLNAGIAPNSRCDFMQLSPEDYDQVMNTNLKGNFFFAQAVAEQMLACAGEHFRSIQLISSVSSEMVSVDRAAYCLSKSGLSMLSQILTLRLVSENIHTYEIRPGIIKTPMTEKVQEKYDPLIANGTIPQKRWGYPDDVSSTVVALAKGLMPFSSGSVIYVDGGLHLKKL